MKLSNSHSTPFQPTGESAGRVRIAILDGRVDTSHPVFVGARLEQLPSPLSSSCQQPSAHATHVASIIFGQHGTQVAGIAPDCTGLLVPVFPAEQPGRRVACSQLDLVRAISVALENGAHVINISGGQLDNSGQAEPMLARVLDECLRRNVLVVAAAGNDGCACLHVPAAIKSVLAVGAMDDRGRPLPSSNWGSTYRTNGLLAPGHNVLGAVPGGGVERRSGTSFATPCVSSFAALLIALQLQLGRRPDPGMVRRALLQSSLPCGETEDDCRKVLAGRLNFSGASELILADGKTEGDSPVTDVTTYMPTERVMPLSENIESGSASEDAIINVGIASDIVLLEPNDAAALPVAIRRPSGGAINSRSMDARSARRQTSSAQVVASDARSAEIAPSCGCDGNKPAGGGCGCGGAGAPQLVYAIGRIGYDFGSEARRDGILQAMNVSVETPFTDDRLLEHLQRAPFDAPTLTWTLNVDATPIYAIQPVGPYAAAGYDRLREFLNAQLHEHVELISIPGIIDGSTRLQSGQLVPVIVPELRGMYDWSTTALVQQVLGPRPETLKDNSAYPELARDQAAYDANANGLTDYLNRVYYDMRNLGLTAEERALNFSATNAVQAVSVINSATSEALDLDTLDVKRSPICRPDSDCYDVELSFFNPNNTNVATRVFRFTVDVSDVIPVSIGQMRTWTKR